MDSTIVIRKEDGSSDSWQFRDIELHEILTRERRSRLGEAYLLWSDFVHPSMVTDFDPPPGGQEAAGADGGCLALAEVFRLDCERSNPFDFCLVLPGRPEPGIRIGDVAPEHRRHVLALEMSYAKGYRRPLYQHISQCFGGVSRERFRLLLPVLGPDGQVGQIYGFCRPAADAPASPGQRSRFAPRTGPGA